METIAQLTQDEKTIIESHYGPQMGGYNPRKLEAVRNLNAQEKKFFAGNNLLSPHFFIQTLYKVRGSISPIKFSLAVTRILEENENLRANFCNVGERTVKVIKPAAVVKPETIFRNLARADKNELDDDFRKVFEADMRRDIDLQHDPLVRFAVYKTSEDDFAVLVTLVQMIADSFDPENFFYHVLGIPIDLKPKKIPAKPPKKNLDAIRDYWTKILDQAPPIAALPYEQQSSDEYSHKFFRKIITDDVLSHLNFRSQSNRAMLTAILQTAWGFMLQMVNKQRDCLFCQILSSSVEDNPFFSVIPIRLIGDNNLTIEQIVRGQFRQLIVSQPYALEDGTALSDLTGQKKLFSHFLNFIEISPNGLNYVATPAEPQGKIICRNSWDAQGMKLGVYFRYSKKSLSVGFLYDDKTFPKNSIERLCDMYKLILQLLLVDWNMNYLEFVEQLRSKVEMQLRTEKSSKDDRQQIHDFFSQLPILQGYGEETSNLFEENAKLVTLYEGDRISNEMLKANVVFVLDGILSRNADTGDGWYNTLDIIEENTFVNPTHLLEKQPFKLSATVLTYQAELVTIPHEAFVEILRKNSEITLAIMNYALEQMSRYQTLWLQL